MTNSINTNSSALVALQTLNSTNQGLDGTQNRISTGLKVADAKDDSAIWSIAQTIRSQRSAFDSVIASLNRGKSTLDVANTAGTAISDLLTQLQQTVLAASDVSLDQQSRASYQQKYASVSAQITNYVKNASFNGANLIDGSISTYSALANTDGTSTIQVQAQSLKLATGYSGGSAGTFSSIAGLSGGPGIATYASRITAASTFGVTVDGVTTTVNLSATGGSQGNGQYTTADLVAAINGTTGLPGVASIDANGGLKLTSPTNTTTGVVSVGSGTGTLSATAATLAGQLGLNAATGSAQSLPTAFVETGGGGNILISGLEQFTSTTNYADLITKLKQSIANVSSALGSLGASNNAIGNHLTFVTKLQDSLTTGIGNLVDADVAKESANLQALQVKQQLGVQSLSIANQAPQIILSLFK